MVARIRSDSQFGAPLLGGPCGTLDEAPEASWRFSRASISKRKHLNSSHSPPPEDGIQKCRNQTPPRGHGDGLSKAGREPTVSLPTPPSRKNDMQLAPQNLPLANPSLRLDQESNISNPRHPYEQPQASHHTPLQYDFSYMPEPIRKPPSQRRRECQR
ncbi:hypothetical protein B0T18DRAFT_394811 [Schizothecium vesticola]|uniref:Uncharacterized protein n=1 Tax=Schizothecium vesticola TaxID=314040 RepID=A0AA40BQI2_9PEZI|nr:hypothetical protein B0T18DRAFT_394811 [Schizothecium vesticola]